MGRVSPDIAMWVTCNNKNSFHVLCEICIAVANTCNPKENIIIDQISLAPFCKTYVSTSERFLPCQK